MDMINASCQRCERLPELSSETGRLILWPPLGHTLAKLKATASKLATVEDIAGGILVDLSENGATRILAALDGALTPGEQADTFCLLTASGPPPSAEELAKVSNLRKLVGLSGAKWLLEVLESDRLGSFFQPIVNAARPTEPFAHECLLRWRDDSGQWNAPADLFRAAREADLLFQLDRRAREINIRNAVDRGVTSKIFLNFTPTAIYDPRNCLAATIAVIRDVGLSPENVVFEVVETELVDDPAHLKSIMDYYKSHGFGVALDDLGSGYSTLQLLGKLLPDYVKLDMELIRNVHQDRFKSELVRHIIELAHGFGVRVVAEGVETQAEAAWLLSQEVDFMQGYYFAKPGPHPLARVDRRQKSGGPA